LIEVLRGGLLTTVQDYPGRIGYWHIGVPPSRPMDSLAFWIANRLVGNPDGEAAFEITAQGPKLRFRSDARLALCGAALKASLDGEDVPWWELFSVKEGATLTLGSIQGGGYRTYLAVAGGIDVPAYLGSRSTFVMGGFGGHEGRPLESGDVLRIGRQSTRETGPRGSGRLRSDLVPVYSADWEIAALPGPHTSPDFFTEQDVDMFFSTGWQVHHNSNRFGYRLEGPVPSFARAGGGEGGRHPSNLPDCAYAVGTVNFTGTMPIILAVDGPSLGGFISLATVATAERWKLGQARPGDTIRFRPVTVQEAVALRTAQDELIEAI